MSAWIVGYPGLMTVLLACHFLGDFSPLSTPRMLEAKRAGTPGWIVVHALVHAALVGMAIVAFAAPTAAVVATAFAIELGTHFGIDLARARIGLRWSGLADPETRGFWYLLGLDQLAHGAVLVAIASLVVGA